MFAVQLPTGTAVVISAERSGAAHRGTCRRRPPPFLHTERSTDFRRCFRPLRRPSSPDSCTDTHLRTDTESGTKGRRLHSRRTRRPTDRSPLHRSPCARCTCRNPFLQRNRRPSIPRLPSWSVRAAARRMEAARSNAVEKSRVSIERRVFIGVHGLLKDARCGFSWNSGLLATRKNAVRSQ